MAAPAALVGTSAGGDEIHRTLAVSVAPGFYITANVHRMTSRPWLAVEIGDLRALWRFVEIAGRVEVGKSWDAGAGVRGAGTERFEQILHREFALAEDNEVRTGLEIFKSIRARLGASHDGPPAGFASNLQNLDHIATCHEIGIDADHGWRFC